MYLSEANTTINLPNDNRRIHLENIFIFLKVKGREIMKNHSIMVAAKKLCSSGIL